MTKFFLYARKSTDVEDKQVLSIEAQLTELRAFAKQENLTVIEELVEKRSAKIPGRSIFNVMIERIEKGHANGILAWHPDRLARNSVDGGRIIYLLDTGKLAGLKFPTFWFESTPQGKFMLNIAFGQSKYYIDSLSENVKRGMRQKCRNGIYPGLAPIGYLNDLRAKNIVIDKNKIDVVRQAFELYSKDRSKLDDISKFLAANGVTNRNDKPFKRGKVTFMLSNPFYIGFFKYGKELFEGKHQPAVSKKIFDQVQEVLKYRGRPHHKPKNEPKAFCGLLRCATCHMSITGESKVKHQQNGNIHNYIYYHCTRKNKLVKCNELWISEAELDGQVSKLLKQFSLKEHWAEQLLQMLEKDKIKSAQCSAVVVLENTQKVTDIQNKLQRLLDSFLEQDIEREIYLTKKAQLMGEKKSLEQRVITLKQQQSGWVEPFKTWVN